MPESQVTIYTTPTCVYCRLAKQYFAAHNVAYTEKNVATDASARAEMIQKSGQMGVPVITVNGRTIVGFDEQAIGAELGIA